METHVEKHAAQKSYTQGEESIDLEGALVSPLQFVDNRPEAIAQKKLQSAINDCPAMQQSKAQHAMANHFGSQSNQPKLNANEAASPRKPAAIQRKANHTGLPDQLKAGIENLSGISMDDVKVHYNSNEPAKLQAHAYAQGTEIRLGPGQEGHLPHEAWHVAQQKQGRVKTTSQRNGRVNINDDESLEQEAETMGAKALTNADQTPAQPLKVASAAKSVVQLATWQWSAKTGRWKCIQGHSVAGPPKFAGTADGQTHDDSLALEAPSNAIVRSHTPSAPPYTKMGGPQGGEAYQRYIAELRTAKAAGHTLKPKQEDQLIVADSNAQFLLNKTKALKTPAGQDKVQGQVAQWDGLIAGLLESEGNHVFTRDIDTGELSGQGHSGGTMNVVERTQKGIGRIRTQGDLKRGGGAGSYVRFLADQPRKREPDAAPASSALNVGSIGSLGITVIYDAKAVIQDNSDPAEMAYNPQDSAGRVFGTHEYLAKPPRSVAKRSERLLTAAREAEQTPEPNDHHVPPSIDHDIMANAIEGMGIMLDQAREGQTDEEEYNEAILFSSAKVSCVKAILIHRPAVGKGGVPDRVPIPEEKQEKMKAREESKLELAARDIDILEALNLQNEREKKLLLGTSRTNPDAKARIKILDSEISKNLEELAQLRLKHKKPVPAERFFKKREVTTSPALRSPGEWEGDSIPDEIKQWEHQTGHGGVPMRYLFDHINPAKVTREDLPTLADMIWRAGNHRWEEDKLAAKKREENEARDREQVSSLSVNGTAIKLSPKVAGKNAPSDEELKRRSDPTEAFA
jgi:Domain of unknown function (DUF4157)